ncbi:UBA-like, GBF-interacting protein 1 [Artemisia annua]|uniref:UBA-like, GBF-interacting protein 1 n=1 Tax=Artemisia annua TaxID=35608 RepID=A0A2U1M1R4_ARTAN|nr:UBA-like, GBF-interacting protein 1 [Artemisia annua]
MSNGVPISSKKMIQSLKEIVNGVTDAEIYATLKDCNMDPNEAVNRLLSQGKGYLKGWFFIGFLFKG